MSKLWRTAYLLLGQTILMVCPAQLHAITTLPELEQQLSPTQRFGRDALTFHTPESRVLVLADRRGNIGAMLIHSKTRANSITATVEELTRRITHAEQADIRYSADKHSALILYPEICKAARLGSTGLTNCPRLTSLYNAGNCNNSAQTPHYWHDSGVSLRHYNNDKLSFEITVDMSRELVEYAEIRLAKGTSSTRAIAVSGLQPNLTKAPRNTIRRLSMSLGGATPLSADETSDIYLSRGKDVYCIGSQERLQAANSSRNNINHYIFPPLSMPPAPVQLPTAQPEPAPVVQPTAPATPVTEQQSLSPAEARRAYIEYLQKM